MLTKGSLISMGRIPFAGDCAGSFVRVCPLLVPPCRGNSQFKGTTGSTCVRACVRACARKCARSHTNAALNAVPRPRWYHSAWRMVSFAPAFSVGRAGATSLPALEESRDRKLATNPERIRSAFDTMSSTKRKLQPGLTLNESWEREARVRRIRERRTILFCTFRFILQPQQSPPSIL